MSAYDGYHAYQSGGWSAAAASLGRDAALFAATGGTGKALGYGYNAWKAGRGARIAAEFEQTAASSIKQGADLKEHFRQLQKYGSAKELENGRIRYYGDLKSPRTPGEMAGWRRVREWDPSTGNKRNWGETLDHFGRIRQVRPQNGETKVHYRFDASGKYTGEW
jgi:hypothetical protein